ncbi:MAG: lactate utilization protein [Firmicutes bacterium]|nr:lactate utilization protein [Bacillota bacterium]MCL5015396.1 lactate utilization protein [Bacillota bacterium]
MAGQLPYDNRPWPERRDAALQNQTMRHTIGFVTRRFTLIKGEIYRTSPDLEASRKTAVGQKRQAIRDLPQLLEQFRNQVEGRGAHTYLAAQAQDAVDIALNIARSHQAELVIKSKSMVTEEIELNQAFEKAGIPVRETDLGEYIIQLAKERPSHILAPAAHRNRHQVEELFQADASREKISPPQSDEIEDLTRYARSRLRQEFLRADMGVTGGNFLVAETGTLVLITNEGNADMVTSLPPVLVSIVGVEKIVRDWASLTEIIQQPAMSGIGRHLSSYTTMIQGPKSPGSVEGPREWHVILVDNGRMALRDTEFEDVLSCIRCGACLNACPVFREVGGHAYGSVYPGPIGIVETPLLTDFQVLPELPSALCTLCHACQEACPMDIALPDHIISLRHTIVKRHLNSSTVNWTLRTWARFWSTPGGYRRSISLARVMQRLSGKKRNAQGLFPGIFAGWGQTREIPQVAPKTFHEWWQEWKERAEEK